jgi:hypothetical protein
MRERASELLVYGPIVALLLLIALAILLLAAPLIGGGLGELHSALRDMLADDDHVPVDLYTPANLGGAQRAPRPRRLPSFEDTTIPLLPVLPEWPARAHLRVSDISCAAIHFEASLGIERGYLSFGRFNVVSGTDPYGTSDPLTQWKLFQFGGLQIQTRGIAAVPSASIQVDQTANIRISDPYTDVPLLSAKWQVDAIEAWGRSASINADLVPNLSALGINNAIESPTLDRFASESRGVLVMGFEHTVDIAPALAAGEPVYASAQGTVYPESCFR